MVQVFGWGGGEGIIKLPLRVNHYLCYANSHNHFKVLYIHNTFHSHSF